MNKCLELVEKNENLEQKNNILKAFIKTHHPEIAKINDITLDVVVKATDEQLKKENKQLKEQLAEKDKEINKLQQMAIIDMQAKEILELQVATIRKQVCDELRDYFEKFAPIFIQVKTDVLDKLDQIEQAKEK